MKNALIHLRASMKFFILLCIGFFIIVALIMFVYKPMYSVTINGEFLGYTEDKSKLQNKINEYMKSGDNSLVAFVEIDTLPEYEICLLKRENSNNDDEIFDKIISKGTAYYKYYAILEDSEEKYYVQTYDDAEAIIDELKEKESSNIDDISYAVKYETEVKEFANKEDAVAELYEEPVKEEPVNNNKRYNYSAYENDNGSYNANIGIALAEPISSGYVLTSRFGYRNSGYHTGLDIASPLGTDVRAAASGVVSYSGWKGTYGYTVIIDHGNGVQTYYAHCNDLYVTAGEYVSQGEVISAVGSTGNSTGPHLHLEVRINDSAQNPQNYVY